MDDTRESFVHANVRPLIAFNRACHRMRFDSGDVHTVKSVGIVGAGLMGTAVAAASVAAGLRVVLADSRQDALDRAADNVRGQLIGPGGLAREQVDSLLSQHLVATKRIDATAACDLVLESIPEDAGVKRRLYAELAPRLAEHAVLATNTSTIPIEQLAAVLPRPERFCGLHFFHPVAQRSLVEVVRGRQTAASTVAAAVGFAQAIDKEALVIADGPGFVVNRLLMPYLTEAVELLLDGVPVERIERVATDFGMAKGPLRLIDEIGLDTVVAGGKVLWRAFPNRVVLSPLVVALYKAGRFGVKSGAGFFDYTNQDGDGAGRVDPFALRTIAEWARTPQRLDDERLRDRVLLPMVAEAARLLEEGRVSDPREIDMAVVLGLGFPAQRGGLLRWADTIGSPALVERLGRLESLGARMEPPELLRRMAKENRPFHMP
jgi:3-hydroxyacyl-CoA dehydrogenase